MAVTRLMLPVSGGQSIAPKPHDGRTASNYKSVMAIKIVTRCHYDLLKAEVVPTMYHTYNTNPAIKQPT